MRFPKVYICILNWNSLPDTLECLQSVFSLDYQNFEVIVVDNNSSESPVESIASLYPDVKLIVSPANLGFTGGNNLAMAYAMENECDYMWLLNNDAVVEADSLRQLVEYAEANESVGLVSPVIYHFDDRSQGQFAGSRVNWKNLLIEPYTGAEDDASLREGEDICLVGAALLIKRRVVETIGYLNDAYFAYWEDTEYSLRSLCKGFRNAVCSSAKVYHKMVLGQLLLGGKKPHYYYFMWRNRFLLGREFSKSSQQKFRFFRQSLAAMLRSLGHCRRNGNMEGAAAILNGAWHGFRSVSGPMRSENAMPETLRKLFLLLAGSEPFFLANIINFDWRAIAGQFSRLRTRRGKKEEPLSCRG